MPQSSGAVTSIARAGQHNTNARDADATHASMREKPDGKVSAAVDWRWRELTAT